MEKVNPLVADLEKMYADINKQIGAPFEGVLTADQVEAAVDYLEKHKSHVIHIADQSTTLFPPTLSEDKRDPRLWKGGHWRWFLKRALL